MIEDARESGRADESVMLKSIDAVDSLLESIRDAHPDVYWKFIRNSHETLYGPHYDKEFAEYDLNGIKYTDADGNDHSGPHWTLDEVVSVTDGQSFAEDVTDYDKWVAYNAAYADFCRKFDDDQILDIAYLFFFDDEDWEGDGKVWEYMNSRR